MKVYFADNILKLSKKVLPTWVQTSTAVSSAEISSFLWANKLDFIKIHLIWKLLQVSPKWYESFKNIAVVLYMSRNNFPSFTIGKENEREECSSPELLKNQ